MRHVLQWTVCVVCVGACAMPAVGKNIPSTLPTTRGADQAKDTFDAATSAANDRMDTANATAGSAYLAELKTALALAMASANLAESNGIKAEIDQMSNGSGVNADTPRRPGTRTARIKYDRAILKAKEEYLRGVEAAQRQYIADLQLAVRAALKDQDLDEANRINALISEVKKPPAPVAAGRPMPPVKSSANPLLAPASAVTTVDGHRHVDLLSLVNPHSDAVTGSWVLAGGILSGTSKGDAQIEFPYVPPMEYDYRIEFELKQIGVVAPISSVAGRQFAWLMTPALNGLKALDHKSGLANVTTNANAPLQIGKHYVVTIKIRRDHLQTYLDDVQVINFQTDYSNFGLWGNVGLIHDNTLGLNICDSAIKIDSSEVTEITGEGHLLRGESAAPVGAEHAQPTSQPPADGRQNARGPDQPK